MCFFLALVVSEDPLDCNVSCDTKGCSGFGIAPIKFLDEFLCAEIRNAGIDDSIAPTMASVFRLAVNVEADMGDADNCLERNVSQYKLSDGGCEADGWDEAPAHARRNLQVDIGDANSCLELDATQLNLSDGVLEIDMPADEPTHARRGSQVLLEEQSGELAFADSPGLSCTLEVRSFDQPAEIVLSHAPALTPVHQSPRNGQPASAAPFGFSCTSEMCSFHPLGEVSASSVPAPADAGASPSPARANALSRSLRHVRRHGVSIAKPPYEAPPNGADLSHEAPPSGAACDAHASCIGLGLSGDCCPTADGVSLWCCVDGPYPPLS